MPFDFSKVLLVLDPLCCEKSGSGLLRATL